mgnify:CR=1 FL=1
MKMAKKVLAVLLSVLFVVGVFTACSSNSGDTKKKEDTTNSATSKLKVGFIFLHDENSTYDLNFITAAKAACEKLGIAYETKTNIPEGQECYDAAAELADAGCDIIFADSFGHESYMIQAALEFPEVEFCHATGTKAHTENLPNYHNAFATIYEGRYLAGVLAGPAVGVAPGAGPVGGRYPRSRRAALPHPIRPARSICCPRSGTPGARLHPSGRAGSPAPRSAPA